MTSEKYTHSMYVLRKLKHNSNKHTDTHSHQTAHGDVLLYGNISGCHLDRALGQLFLSPVLIVLVSKRVYTTTHKQTDTQTPYTHNNIRTDRHTDVIYTQQHTNRQTHRRHIHTTTYKQTDTQTPHSHTHRTMSDSDDSVWDGERVTRAYDSSGDNLDVLFNGAQSEVEMDDEFFLQQQGPKRQRLWGMTRAEIKDQLPPTVDAYTSSIMFKAEYTLVERMHTGGMFNALRWGNKEFNNNYELYRKRNNCCGYHLVHTNPNYHLWDLQKSISSIAPKYSEYQKTSHFHNADFPMVPEQCCGTSLKSLCWLPGITAKQTQAPCGNASIPVFVDHIQKIVRGADATVWKQHPIFKIRSFFHGACNLFNVNWGLGGNFTDEDDYARMMKRLAEQNSDTWMHVMSFLTQNEAAVFAHSFSSRTCALYGVSLDCYNNDKKAYKVKDFLNNKRLTYDLSNFCNRHASRALKFAKNTHTLDDFLARYTICANRAVVPTQLRGDTEEERSFGVHPLQNTNIATVAGHVVRHLPELMTWVNVSSAIYLSADEDETKEGLLQWHANRLRHVDTLLAREKASNAWHVMCAQASEDCALYSALKAEAQKEFFNMFMHSGSKKIMGDGFNTAVAQYVIQFSNSFFACPRRMWAIFHMARDVVGDWHECTCPDTVVDHVKNVITYLGSDKSPIVRKLERKNA